jgi:hypothetical protein
MKKMMILVLALVMTFAALPAFAQDKADWAFYGSVRMWTAWEMVDDNTPAQLSSSGFFPVATTAARAYTFGGVPEGDDELGWLLQGNSRIGANVKWGNVGGRFEYGHGGAANAPSLRLLYGTWNFGSGTLLVGQDYGPYFYLVSGLCGPGGQECNGIGFGSIYSGRNPQLKLIFGGLQLALVSPATVASYQPTAVVPYTPQTLILNSNQTTAGTGYTDLDRVFPKLEASYTFNLGPAQLFIGGIYNTYTEVYNVGGRMVENDVDGWALGAGTKMAFGPFYANATFQYGTNPNNSGSGPATLYPSVMLYNPATDVAADADYMAAQLILGFKLTDSMQFEGGVIWQNGQLSGAGLDAEQTTWTYYIGLGWSPAKNVFIVPELGVVDYNKLESAAGDLEYGKLTWFGIKWQINF